MNKNDLLKNKVGGWPNRFGSNLYELVNNLNGAMEVTDMLLGCSITPNKYPPRNIKQYKFDDRIEHIVEFALAGFKKSEIKVTKNGKFIEVAGSKTPVPDENTPLRNAPIVMENGISFKNFNHRFELNTMVDSVSDYQISSKFEDGLLTVKIVKAITQKQAATEINID
jgi:HSP20 family molecular chaperone IbpA